MHHRNVLKALLLVAAASAAIPAAAQMRSDEHAPGFYAGGTVGRNDNDRFAWRAFGGYQANRYLGAEFGYHDLGQVRSGIDGNAWELVGVGRLPIVDRLSAYAKLGGYRGSSKGNNATETNTDLTYGFGAEYDVTRNVAVRAEWQRYNDLGGGGLGNKDADVVSVGAIYRFR